MKLTKLIAFSIVLAISQPAAPLKAQSGPDRKTKRTEAEYQACLKEARALQKRYSQCGTKECTDAVTKEFDAWSDKCLSE